MRHPTLVRNALEADMIVSPYEGVRLCATGHHNNYEIHRITLRRTANGVV